MDEELYSILADLLEKHGGDLETVLHSQEIEQEQRESMGMRSQYMEADDVK